jgi:hypothetical protein
MAADWEALLLSRIHDGNRTLSGTPPALWHTFLICNANPNSHLGNIDFDILI